METRWWLNRAYGALAEVDGLGQQGHVPIIRHLEKVLYYTSMHTVTSIRNMYFQNPNSATSLPNTKFIIPKQIFIILCGLSLPMRPKARVLAQISVIRSNPNFYVPILWGPRFAMHGVSHVQCPQTFIALFR
jgi:hypothetical protein